MRETIEQSRMRIQEFEERQRRVKQEPMENPDVADYRSWQLSNAEVCQVSNRNLRILSDKISLNSTSTLGTLSSKRKGPINICYFVLQKC